MKAEFAIYTVCFPFLLFAQQDTSREYIFRVRNPGVTYTIWPNDSILWCEKENKIVIRQAGKRKAYRIRLDGGRIKGTDSIYFASVDSVPRALLSVLERSGGKWKVVCSKSYWVKRIPDPIVYICGVKTDSVIDKQQLIIEDNVTAYSPYYKIFLKVVSFNMIIMSGGKLETMTANTNHFTLEMRRRIHALTTGNVLFFDSIKCVMPDGNRKVLPAVQIYIDETDKYKIGYRTTRN